MSIEDFSGNYVRIDDWLYFGNNHHCGEHNFRSNFDRTIHIWRDDHPNQLCQSCNIFDDDILIEYKDGANIPESLLNDIFLFYKKFESDFPDKTGKLYVHCAAGQTRSATIALFIHSIGLKRHPATLINHFYWRGYDYRKFILNICENPLMDIINYYDNNSRNF